MYTVFWLVAGLLAGAWYIAFASKSHAGRERKAYSNGLLIAAAIYLVFALFPPDAVWLGIEALGVVAYGVFVWLGRRFSFYFVAAGWLLHPIWDVVLHLDGPGRHIVPGWYAIACVSFDVLLAVVIARQVATKGHKRNADGWHKAPGAPIPSLVADAPRES